jgi:hypothetical protein
MPSVHGPALAEHLASMASHTLFGRGLVKKHGSSFDHSHGVVAALATYLAMRARQRERGLFVVVKERWFPSRGVMTAGTFGDPIFRKLQAMDIGMASLASRGRRREIDAKQPSCQARWFVAAGTLRRFMCPGQRKCGLRMIEPGEILPHLRGMATFAPGCSSARIRPTHERVKPPVVRVGVAACASQARPAILRSGFRLEIRRTLVTIQAWNRLVASGKEKLCLVVPAQPECGGQKSLHIVTIFAAVEVRSGRELFSVFIGVAVGAIPEPDRIDGGRSLRNMTLRATQPGMFAQERIGCRRVLFNPERGRLETLDRVAGGTFASPHALGELSSVWIGPVTVCALLKCQRLVEVCSCVTTDTFHPGVFAQQGKLRLRVVECAVHLRQRRSVPARGAVTGLAGLLETAAVGIGMAVAAAVKRNPSVTRQFVGSGSVALPAGNRGM